MLLALLPLLGCRATDEVAVVGADGRRLRVGPPLAEGAALTWLEAVRAANDASAEGGLDLCYLVEPAGRGSEGPPATWVRGCDGYRLPAWDEAAVLGQGGVFWVWDSGEAPSTFRLWPSGEGAATERHRALRFRGPRRSERLRAVDRTRWRCR